MRVDRHLRSSYQTFDVVINGSRHNVGPRLTLGTNESIKKVAESPLKTFVQVYTVTRAGIV
jgi:hypothetical protein